MQQPSVQYRGIFLNDEDWGLMPWSSKNFEQTSVKGQIGPKTYAKFFELLCRLRANTIWPAMHECTVPFYFVNGTKEMADKYGIVMATSHCEPLMRNNHPVNGGSIRYAVSVDNEKPQVVAYETGFRSEPWKINVLRNQSLNTTLHKINIPGKHAIRISALDPEVIVDQLMLDFNKDRKFYKIPIESSNNE